jgi:protein-S-isoprenylcysteine O-methyltransferase Ste14
MSENDIYHFVLISWMIAAVISFVTLFFINAPYGRHMKKGWGLDISNRIGWMLMESPSALLFIWLFVSGSNQKTQLLLVFFALWEAHYLHRAFIYPFTLSNTHKRIPVVIVLMGFIFNAGNAFINGYYLFSLSDGYPLNWLLDFRFILGMVLFISGFTINRRSDQLLRALRKPGDVVYHIPEKGLFRWVSSPNYFGEIVEWIGWALATWSIPGTVFALWTIANLLPRARSNHVWYRKNFPDYPSNRKALIPGVW